MSFPPERATHVDTETDRVRWVSYLFLSYRPLRGLMQLLERLGITTEIFLAADEDDGEAGAEMDDFGDPLRQHPSSAFSISSDASRTWK